MAVNSEDAVKLVAPGKTIMLGGSPTRIVFDMPAFVEIERRWGSLAAFWKEFEKGQEGKLYTCLSDAIAVCVRDLPKGINPLDLMDTKHIIEYANVIGPAFLEAMPDVGQREVEGGEVQEADRPLTGEPSSTSPSSAGGWHPPTSGE